MSQASDSFRRLLSLGDKDGNTNIHHLAAEGKLYLLLDNLKTKVKVDAKNNNGETPLYMALVNGHFEVVCFLLRHGADATNVTPIPRGRRKNGFKRTGSDVNVVPSRNGSDANHFAPTGSRRNVPTRNVANISARRINETNGVDGRRSESGSTIPSAARTRVGANVSARARNLDQLSETDDDDAAAAEGARTGNESPLVTAVEKSYNLSFFKVLTAAQYRLSENNAREKPLFQNQDHELQLSSSTSSSNVSATRSDLSRLLRQRGQPIFLKNLARQTLRQHLVKRVTRGRSIENAVGRLPLPSALKGFLLFEINEDFRLNFETMLEGYIERKAFGWEKMLIEIEASTNARKSFETTKTTTESGVTPAEDLLLEEMLDRPVDFISDRDRRRAISRLAETTDPRIPTKEEEEEDFINLLLQN